MSAGGPCLRINLTVITSNGGFSFMVFTFLPCAPDSPLERRVMPFDVVLQFVWECHKTGYVGNVSFFKNLLLFFVCLNSPLSSASSF